MWNLPLLTPATRSSTTLPADSGGRRLPTFQYDAGDVLGRRAAVRFLELERNLRLAHVFLLVSFRVHRAGHGEVHFDAVQQEFRLQRLREACFRLSTSPHLQARTRREGRMHACTPARTSECELARRVRRVAHHGEVAEDGRAEDDLAFDALPHHGFSCRLPSGVCV